jgi:hypothetical protein
MKINLKVQNYFQIKPKLAILLNCSRSLRKVSASIKLSFGVAIFSYIIVNRTMIYLEICMHKSVI